MDKLTHWYKTAEKNAKPDVEYLVWNAAWETPSIAVFKKGDCWYCPNTGCEITPQPTYFTELPKPPLALA